MKTRIIEQHTSLVALACLTCSMQCFCHIFDSMHGKCSSRSVCPSMPFGF